jgi:hypothetical protein
MSHLTLTIFEPIYPIEKKVFYIWHKIGNTTDKTTDDHTGDVVQCVRALHHVRIDSPECFHCGERRM